MTKIRCNCEEIGPGTTCPKHCSECNKIILLDTHYLQSGPWLFHLTCYNKYCSKKIEEANKIVTKFTDRLNLLKPYAKEMICESLEIKK